MPTTSQDISLFAKRYDESELKSAFKKHKNSSFFEKLNLLFEMLKDREFKLSDSSKLLIMGALGYMLFPFDAIPDLAPIVGFIDDAAVIGIVWSALLEDIKRFLRQKDAKDRAIR